MASTCFHYLEKILKYSCVENLCKQLISVFAKKSKYSSVKPLPKLDFSAWNKILKNALP